MNWIFFGIGVFVGSFITLIVVAIIIDGKERRFT